MEEDDAQQYGAHGTDAGPDSIGGAHGNRLDSLGEQHHAECVEEDEAQKPSDKGMTRCSIHLAQTEGKCHLA